MTSAAADNLLLFALVLFLAAAFWRYGVGLVFETRILQRQREADKLRQDIERAVREADDLDEQYQAARPLIERLRRDIAAAKRKLAELAKGRYVVVQQMGRPGDGRRCFVFELFRGEATAQESRPTFDPRFWHHRNFVEVWAADAHTASRQVALTFDPRSGFRRSALIEERGDER